ncbi:head-to-tail connector protein [Enterobacter phage 04_vB_Eclo_IJM]|nr:head-to-tail connector protein [Enterobacter phage 04_vB_Eclo_IJM]
MADAIEQRLGWAFLLNSAVQRNAERVTAEEIRYVAGS